VGLRWINVSQQVDMLACAGVNYLQAALCNSGSGERGGGQMRDILCAERETIISVRPCLLQLGRRVTAPAGCRVVSGPCNLTGASEAVAPRRPWL